MIRRIFMATINADHPQQGMIQAFEGLFAAPRVFHFDYLQRIRDGKSKEAINAEFIEEAVRHKAHWMWLQLQNTNVIQSETLERIKKELPRCVISHWCGDVRPEVGDYFASICRASHLTLVANRGFMLKYSAAGAREVRYVPHGLDFSEDVLGLPDWTPPFTIPDVVYCGNHYGADMVGSEVRESCVRALHEAGIAVGVVGNGWENTKLPVLGQCKVKQQVHVYRKAKVALSVNHFPNLTGYHGDRTITAMASGTAVVQRRFPEIEKEFKDGEDLLVFWDEKELVEKVKILLDNEPMRKELGARGRAAVLKSHTWFTRILEVLPRVEEIRDGLPGA